MAHRCVRGSSGSLATSSRSTCTASNWCRNTPASRAAAAATGKTRATTGTAGSEGSGRLGHPAAFGLADAVEVEGHPGSFTADEFGHRLAGTGAMRPAQRAVAGVDPQLAHA